MADASVHTTARNVRVADDDWAWLDAWAQDRGIERASVIRRLITLLRQDAATRVGRPWRIHNRVIVTPDPVGARRNANLTGGRA